MALPPAMRAGMSAAIGKIPPFCVLRLLFRVLHLPFRGAFFRRTMLFFGKND